MFDTTDFLAVNTVRTLSMDMIQKANSGHPGLPMGAAPMAYVLWTKHLNINPKTSRNWVDRDRFVLSAGHGSALLYSLLHLSGYNLTIDDLKGFRQWGSLTPGHPEVNHTDGVEATTGPLGQGIAMAVGMAMSEAHLAATYNKEDGKIVDHYTYALCGDGDLMEGISHEAASLAGHLKLGKLNVLYDSNDISLDGPTSKAFTENVGARFEAYGWQHILVKDGNDLQAIDQAIEAAKKDTDQPTLIEVKTVIGYGAPHAGSSKVHGAPLGVDGVVAAKKTYGWNFGEDFYVPEEVAERFQEAIVEKGGAAEKNWQENFAAYEKEYPELAAQFLQGVKAELPAGWQEKLPVYEVGTSQASRVTSKEVLQILSENMPSLWGGSADLSASNNTMIAAETDFQADNYVGRNIWFGVREFAMAAIMNGILLHGGTKIYGGTFFVFVDYLRPAVRLAAIQKLPVIYVLTHDSVAVGEDGPTHEPVEQLSSLRGMPNLSVIRPADANEVVAAWEIALESTDHPTALILSRQNLPVLAGTAENADQVKRGAYVLSAQKGTTPDGILLATGSEVALAMAAQEQLAAENIDVSVVSVPSFDLFKKQDASYQEAVLPKEVTKRVAVEMAATFGWGDLIGSAGKVIGIDRFGESAQGPKIIEAFDFTSEHVVKTFKSL
ncbi:transketolase [Enterococcus timonensis]|uniref:transketolase n=1 Tax=Enterococcus timonensis TaxID=1852364 RepID=UPI0008D9E61D|nr:transketolase [Enterococcus timonensis]